MCEARGMENALHILLNFTCEPKSALENKVY